MISAGDFTPPRITRIAPKPPLRVNVDANPLAKLKPPAKRSRRDAILRGKR